MTNPIKKIQVDAPTLQHYIDHLASIGWQPEGGIVRPVYSPAWLKARQQLAEWMRAAGLHVYEDAVGNLFGRLRGLDDTRTILTGSHLDTVKLGGKFDGALGILAGLVALQALHKHLGPPQRSLEVVALCEEENSRFHARYWGTRAILGLIEESQLEALRDEQDISIASAMRAAGLPPDQYRAAIRTDLDAFLELHIEQGRILFDEHIDIGIVQAITGLQHLLITVKGRADHAGTTPMDLRRDALQGAALMAVEITRLVQQEGRPAVVTLGQWDVRPGAVNVVPAEVRFSIDLRHPDAGTLQRLSVAIQARCQAIAQERDLQLSSEITGQSAPQQMDPALQALLIRAAGACGATWKAMPSGAGHDSQTMARHLPTAMLFVPSIEGRSHSAAEETPLADAARGATVLATALSLLAYP
ncbi:MAG: M20 family metallo-hydrolase [Chloroflexi bacterium]|nr:MAG: M20 family metallo-hydrolase [Chloroflexota bacterium]